MRLFFYSLLITISCFGLVFAENREENVTVALEIEGEYKFEPFGEPSVGFAGLADNGFLRIIKESDSGLPKYEALAQAMMRARSEVFSIIEDGMLTGKLSMKDAVKAIPPFVDEENNDKEKPFDYYKYTDNVRECGKYKNSGRYYDPVDGKGSACLEVDLNKLYASVGSEEYSVFNNVSFYADHNGVVRNYVYDGFVIDASDVEYHPAFGLKVITPSNRTAFSGLIGKSNIFYAGDILHAKDILKRHGASKVYSAKALEVKNTIGLKVSNHDADRIYSVLKRDRSAPIVVIYKDKNEFMALDGENE